MKVGIYLTFDGTCAEAFDFYKSIFGGDFTWKGTYDDPMMGKKVKVAPADHDKILHMGLTVGNLELMGCDHVPSVCGYSLQAGSMVQISLSPTTCQDADRFFAALSAGGGTVQRPMQNMPWGSYHGQLTDRFGVQWMLDTCSDNDKNSKDNNKACSPDDLPEKKAKLSTEGVTEE
jgi:PhnB protein